MEVRGGVVVTATGSPLAVDKIQFQVATAAGGAALAVDPDASQNSTIIAYRDSSVVDNDMTYVATEIVGDGDLLLEPGELTRARTPQSSPIATLASLITT